MVGISYPRLQAITQRLINHDPTTFTIYGQSGATIASGTGRLAQAGSRTLGRMAQTFQLQATQLVGVQLWTLLMAHDTTVPSVGDEVRTSRQGVEQRFNIVKQLKTPEYVMVLLDERD